MLLNMPRTFNVNSTNFSGMVDIVVIKQPDGTYKSSPFHICFGKFKILNSARKNVTISINSVDNDDVKMVLSSGGKAFFMRTVQKGKEGEIDDTLEEESPMIQHIGNQVDGMPSEYNSNIGEYEQYLEDAFSKEGFVEEIQTRNTMAENATEQLQGEKQGIRKRFMSYFKKGGKNELAASDFYAQKS